MVEMVEELAEESGVAGACRMLDVPRSWYYGQKAEPSAEVAPASARLRPANGLSEAEKAAVRALLNSERFCDQPPREVYATLLDEGRYLCHWRTMYRILAEHGEVGDRRGQRRQATYSRPELVARAANEVWSWDITFLAGPSRRCFYYLYVILDIFSRYVVGWMVAAAESSLWAKEFIAATCAKQEIPTDQLTLHSDRGSAMKATTVADLLARLGVSKSHTRPHTPNDNPFSEAQFKTLKYCPTFPHDFADIEAAREWARSFFNWYNHDHHHVGLGLMTPAVVHYGQAEKVVAQRQQVLNQAFAHHRQRFVRGAPQVPQLPQAVWINPPEEIAFPATATAVSQPVAPTGSRNPLSVLDPAMQPPTLEKMLWPSREEKSSLFLSTELSHFS